MAALFKKKRRLTATEEFEIMKMVLDKVLWLGIIIIAYGFFVSISKTFNEGMYYIFGGAIVLLLFAWVIIREFEHLR